MEMCYFCNGPANGAMFSMGVHTAHIACVILALNKLIDPDFEGIGNPVESIGWIIRKEGIDADVKLLEEQYWADAKSLNEKLQADLKALSEKSEVKEQ